MTDTAETRGLAEGLLADAQNPDELADRVATLERQRDVLLEACKRIRGIRATEMHAEEAAPVMQGIADAAIAQVEGEQ